MPRVALDGRLQTSGLDEPASSLSDLAAFAAACAFCSLVLGDETLRRFLVPSDPDCFGVRTYSTHESSGLNVSQIEGMISSGPDTHESVSDLERSAVSAPLLIFGLGSESLGSFFSKAVVEAITHDSPRSRGVGLCSLDMIPTCHGV